MNEKTERVLRRKAMRLLVAGRKSGQILKQVGRSRAWLSKWRFRFAEEGTMGLQSQSRCPQTHPHGWNVEMRRLIVRTRKRLARAPAGLIGARAIRSDLKRLMPRRGLPSESTIQRVLRQEGVIRSLPACPRVYWPAPVDELDGSVDALDWTCRYLEGGQKVYAFHTLNLHTRQMHQTLARDKTLNTAYAHVLDAWKTGGIPRFLQCDNDAVFCGGYQGARLFGRFTRLCLWVGVELIFLPVAEPKRNGAVEQLNGLWGGPAFWERHRFQSFAHVCRLSPRFIDWYMHHYTPPSLKGTSPAHPLIREARPRLTAALARQIPDHLPITAGQVHFLRRVQPDGIVRILNEPWRVGTPLAGQYIWATLTTHRHTLDFWFRRNAQRDWCLLKQVPYAIDEPIHKGIPCFANLFTMS